MRLNQLRYIKYVVEAGSISKAAEQLYISKQGLSLYIRRLETDLGVKLFFRVNSGVRLTKDGEIVYDFIKKILPEYDIMIDRLNIAAEKNKQSLKIAYGGGFFSCISCDLLLSFIEANPLYEVEHAALSDEMVEKSVLDGDFDIAFSTSAVKNPDLEYHFLFHNYRCLFVNTNHPLASLPYVNFSDLKDIKIAISPPGYFDYPFFLNKCHEVMFEPDLFIIRESHMMYQFAKEMRGVSLMIRNISGCQDFGNDLKELYFEDTEGCSYNIYLVTSKKRKESAAAVSFIKHATLFCEKEMTKYQKSHSLPPEL